MDFYIFILHSRVVPIQFSRGHTRGSSHGFSRITRAAYSQPHFAAMMQFSNKLWDSLEKTTGSSFRRFYIYLLT